MDHQPRDGRHVLHSRGTFYDARFKSRALRIILALIFLCASFPYIASVLVAIANAAQYATDGAINYRLAVIVVGLIMTVFVCVGGVKSAATADTVQGLLFVLLLWVIVIAALIVGFGGSLSKAVTKLWDDVPSFFSYPGPDGWVPYASRFGYPFSCAIGWTIMLPHVFVRSGYFGDDLKAQRRLSYMTPVLQGIVWTGTMLIGLIGLALVQGLPTSETELIIPYIVKNFVVSFNPVLAKILMVAFFIGASAVGLSTSNAFLSVASAIVADDLLRNTFHMDLSGKKGVNANRIIIAVLGIGSTPLALDPPELIFTLIMFSIAIVMPLFPVLVLGIYWKKATKQAAIVSSIVGTVLVLATTLCEHRRHLVRCDRHARLHDLHGRCESLHQTGQQGLRSVLRCSQKRHEPQLQDRRQGCCGAGRYEYRRLNHQRIYAGAAAKRAAPALFMPP